MYFQPETLKEMLVSFRQNNEINHITGMMLFSNGSFLQVLEGEDDKIDSLIKKIKKDNRHHSIVQLAEGSITERNFGKWSMSFKAISPEMLKNIEGYINPWDPDFVENLPSDEHPTLAILKVFAQNSRME
ncbi:MAG: BLUF domain-containing protein [Sphingobacteriaceae bacterium]|nr:MAG: BLUF domain-containing protein [Sphingobacteriaceae bacterium]